MDTQKIVNDIKNYLMYIFQWVYILISIVLAIFLVSTIYKILYCLTTAIPIDIETSTFSTLSSVILVIVGIELCKLIISRDYRLMLDVLIFALARKIIIKPEFGKEYMVGYLVLIIFLLLRKYLFVKTE